MSLPIRDPKFDDHLVLVPNQRLLRARQARAMREAGQSAAVGLPEATLSQWYQGLALRWSLLEGRPVLPVAGELVQHALWVDAIRSAPPEEMRVDSSRALESIARQARAAERLLDQWSPDESDARGVNWRRFLQWRASVREARQSRAAGTAEATLVHLVTLLGGAARCPLPLPRQVTLVGFREFTTLERELIGALQQRGITVHHEGLPGSIGEETLRSFARREEEIYAAVRWARDQAADPARRVALVVNGLHEHWEAVHGALLDVFEAGDPFGVQTAQDAEYHIEAGRPLDRHPAVRCAFDLLELALAGPQLPLQWHTLSRWLLSPHWSGATAERGARAALEIALRERYRWTLADVLEISREKNLRERLPILYERLARLPAVEAGAGSAAWLGRVLQHWGWPGGLDVSSEAAELRAFHACLEDVERLGVGDARSALNALRRACADTRVGARGGPFSPVQVLAPDEVRGRHFDALWALNLRRESWPGPARNNPFLPRAVLEQLPSGTEQRVLDEARDAMHAMRTAAGVCTWSWSRFEEDIEQAPSPLLESRTAEHVEHGVACGLWSERAADAAAHAGYEAHRWLHAVEDSRGPGLEAGSRLRGPAQAFALQSACPLAGYLFVRLGAQFDSPPGAFPGADVRGELVHFALEALYKPVAGSARLPDRAEVDAAAAHALTRSRHGRHLSGAARDAEHKRLVEVLAGWLAFDSGRQRLEIAEIERGVEASIADLVVHPRVDRVEVLPGGGLLALDYKTGRVELAGWERERLGQPQLPLYALLLDRVEGPPVRGVAFAVVRPREHGLVGVCDDPAAQFDKLRALGSSGRRAVDKVAADWDALFARWTESLEELAGELRNGACDNRVWDEKALKHAGLSLVLRHEEGRHWCLANTASQ